MTEEQLTGILSVAMNGAVGDAIRQWLDRKKDQEEIILYDSDESLVGVSHAPYGVGRMSMLREIRRGLDAMKNTYSILSKENL